MKRLFLLSILLFLAAAPLSARRPLVRLTRYEGAAITGVEARHLFRVDLVRSEQTRAVVEVDTELEQYLRFELTDDGTVVVDLDLPEGERRRFDDRVRDTWHGRTLHLTLYLPELHRVALSDMSRLTAEGAFTGGEVALSTRDMSRIDSLDLAADSVVLRCTDMSRAVLRCRTERLDAEAGDMARIELTGSAPAARVEARDMAGITGDDFTAERGEIEARDMARASLHVTGSLYLRSRDMGRARYTGDPARVDLQTPQRTERR